MQPPSFFAASLFVAIGGGAGAWLRFAVGRVLGASDFPWATLLVNVAGSLAMGLLAGWLARHGAQGSGAGEQSRLLLGVGLLGGFTTFSAFSLEIVGLIQRGAAGMAAFYILASVAGGILGLYAGLFATRALT